MFDVQGSLTLTNVKPGAKFVSSAKATISQAINGAATEVPITIKVNNAEVKKNLGDIKGLADQTLGPLQKKTKEATTAVNNLNNGIKKAGTAAGGANKALAKTDNIFENLGKQAKSMLTFTLVAGVFYKITRSIDAVIDSIIRFEKDIVNVTKVMNASASETKLLEESVKTLGVTFGFSLGEAANAAAVYAQQGKSMNEVVRLTEASLLLANISILTTTESTEALTAIINQFGFSAEKVVSVIDSLNEVANKYAVTEADITEAIKRSGAAAEEAGVSFEKMSGYVAALQERTRRGGRVIGTALKTIFARLNTDKAISSLRNVGIESFNLEGNFTNLGDRLDKLASIWDNLTNVQRVNIATALAGKRRYSDFLSLMSGYDTSLSATKTAIDSQSSAMIENEKIMGTLDKTIKSVKTSWDAFVVSFSDSGVGTAIGVVAQAFGGIARALSAIPPELITALVGGAVVSGGAKLGGSLLRQFGEFKANRAPASGGNDFFNKVGAANGLGGAGGAFDSRKRAAALNKTLDSVRQSLVRFGDKLVETYSKLSRVTAGGALASARGRANQGIGIGGIAAIGGAAALAGGALGDGATKDSINGIASAATVTAFASMSGFSEKIGNSVGKTAGQMNVILLLAGIILTSVYSIYKAFQKYEISLSLQHGLVTKQIRAYKEVKKELDDYDQKLKSIRQSFAQIEKESEKTFSSASVKAQTEAFKELVVQAPELSQFSDQFYSAAAAGAGVKKVLADIIHNLKLIREEKALGEQKSALDELKREYKTLDSGDKEQLKKAEELARKGAKYFTDQYKGITVESSTALKDLETIEDKAVDAKNIWLDSFEGSGQPLTRGIRDIFENAIQAASDAVRAQIKAAPIVAETRAIGRAVADYKNSIFQVQLSIEKSRDAHKKYDDFIQNTSSVLGDIDFSVKVEDSGKRLEEAKENVKKLLSKGIISPKLLDPFIKQIKAFKGRAASISEQFSGSESKGIVKRFVSSGAAAETDLGQVTGLILSKSIDGGIRAADFGKDKKYTQKIADKISAEFGKEFTVEKIKSVLASYNVGFGAVLGEDIDATIKKLGETLKRSKSVETQLVLAREQSVLIIGSVIEKTNQLNGSYNLLASDSKNIIDTNNRVLSIRNRIASLQFRDAREDQAFAKIKVNNEKANRKNLIEISKMQSYINAQEKLRADLLSKTSTDNRSEQDAQKVLDLNRDIRRQRIDLAKLEISENQRVYSKFSATFSRLSSEASKVRSQAETRSLTTVSDRRRQLRSYDTLLALANKTSFKKGDTLTKREIDRVGAATTQTRPILIKDLDSLISQGGKVGEGAEAFKTAIYGQDAADLDKKRAEINDEMINRSENIEQLYIQINKNNAENATVEQANIKSLTTVLDLQKKFLNAALVVLKKGLNDNKNPLVKGVTKPIESKEITDNKTGVANKTIIMTVDKESAVIIGAAAGKAVAENKTVKNELNIKSSVDIRGDDWGETLVKGIGLSDAANKKKMEKVAADKVKAQRKQEEMFGAGTGGFSE